MINNSILYHGSKSTIDSPLAHIGRADLDFGPGFYVTNDRQQAIDWANTIASRKPHQKAILNIYRFDIDAFLAETKYHLKHFPAYDIEWLDFIAFSRKGQQPWKGLDWIEGGIANDSVISTVDAYIDGTMTAEMAMDKLIKEELRHQVCIANQEIVDRFLSFVEASDVTGQERKKKNS